MNKKALSFTLSSALASTLLSVAPVIQAGENPFAMSSMAPNLHLAAGDEKTMEGKCGEGKCGAEKAKMAADKAAEGKCGAGKAKEGGCGAEKAKTEDTKQPVTGK